MLIEILRHTFPQYPLKSTCLLFTLVVFSRLCCNGHSLQLNSYLSKIGKSLTFNAAPAVIQPRTLLISLRTVQLQTLCTACSCATPFLFTTSSPGTGSCPGSRAPWSPTMPQYLERSVATTITTSTNHNNNHLLLSSYLSRIGRIENRSCSACGHSFQDTSHLILHFQLRTLCAAYSLATLCLSTTSDPGHEEFPGFWGSMVFRHAPIPRKGSGSQQQQHKAVRCTSPVSCFSWRL